uniref:Uncharacterized protein n=1 Tax=Leptobrachium leishanense TaxID=445787 RepID=A0A8C5P6I2_9ANUR
MCPPRVREGGGRSLWQTSCRRFVWDNFPHRPPLWAQFAAALLATCAALYWFPLLSACALCLLGGCLCQSSGRRLLVLAGWRPQLGFVRLPAKRPDPPRRQRQTASFKWSPADLLLLMGSYLGKQDHPPPRGRGALEIKQRLARPNPDVATPSRRLSFRETPIPPNRAYMNPHRRFPVNQTQRSVAGSFSSVPLEGCHAVLSPRNVVHSPVVVRLPPQDRNIENSCVSNMPYGSGLPTHLASDHCATERVSIAIKERRKRPCKIEYPAEGNLDNHKRRRYGNGAPFDPFVPNGFASFVSRETLFDSNKDYLNRRYPTHQPQYSKAGSLPTVFFDGCQKKHVLSPKSIFRPSTVRIPPPDRNIANAIVANLPYGSTSPYSAPDPCAKETVLNALKECRKRQNKDQEYVGDGDLDSKRKKHGNGGDRTSESPVANGPTSLLYKTDGLKRGQTLQTPEENLTKRSRTSSSSSLNSSGTMNGIQMSAHNAITSSYSSSRELLQKRKMALQNKSNVSNSPRCDTPEWPIKRRQELKNKSPITPLMSDSGLQSPEHFIDSPLSKGSSSISPSPNGSAVVGRRRKVLLTCPERDEPYQLPPAPIVGYEITTEDYDAEKKAALQRLNRALEDVPATTAQQNVNPLALPATTKSANEPQVSTASNTLLQSLAKMRDQESSAGTMVSLAQSTASTVPNTTLSFSGISSSPGMQSLVSNPTASLSAPIATSSCTTVLSQPLGSTQSKSQSPKNGLLLQMLSKPQETAQSAFKPIFGVNPPTNPASSAADPAVTASTAASTTFKPVFGENLKPAAPSSETTFKPIFGDRSTQQSTSSPFPSFQVAPKTSISNPIIPASNVTEHGAKPISTVAAQSSNAVGAVSTFQFSSASQGLPMSSTTSILGHNTAQASQTKPVVTFGQTSNAQNSGFSGFGSAQAASTQAKPSIAFGSTTSAFSAPFGSNTTQTAFQSSLGNEGQASKPASSVPNFGTSAPPAFGASTQPSFGTSAGVKPTFSTTTTTFSFGNSNPAATKAATFGGANAQASSNSANTNIFANASATPFSFNGGPNTGVSFSGNNQSASATGSTGFSFGGPQPAAPSAPFGLSPAPQNNIGTPAQNSTFMFGTPGATENKLPFVNHINA